VVQPVLDARCVSCHGPEAPEGGLDLSSDRTDFFSVSYDNLARRYSLSASLVHDWCPPSPDRQPLTSWIPTYNGQEENILNIAPKAWGSYASTLGMVLTTDHADAEGESRVEMTAAEKRRLYAWMDLNVPYYGASLSNHPDRKGCRRMLPEQLDTVLADVAERRCVSCHETTPRDFFVRVESPERNAFLDAPLAKAAGGDGRCGEAVFATRDDPDYQAILDTFGPVEALLLTTPRLDMPGGEAVLSSLPAESCLQGASEGSEK